MFRLVNESLNENEFKRSGDITKSLGIGENRPLQEGENIIILETIWQFRFNALTQYTTDKPIGGNDGTIASNKDNILIYDNDQLYEFSGPTTNWAKPDTFTAWVLNNPDTWKRIEGDFTDTWAITNAPQFNESFKRSKDITKSLGIGEHRFSKHETNYINGVIATEFEQWEIDDPKIDIDEVGYYWADKDDNYSYSDYTGPFSTREEAIEAGKQERIKLVLTKWRGESVNEFERSGNIHKDLNIGKYSIPPTNEYVYSIIEDLFFAGDDYYDQREGIECWATSTGHTFSITHGNDEEQQFLRDVNRIIRDSKLDYAWTNLSRQWNLNIYPRWNRDEIDESFKRSGNLHKALKVGIYAKPPTDDFFEKVNYNVWSIAFNVDNSIKSEIINDGAEFKFPINNNEKQFKEVKNEIDDYLEEKQIKFEWFPQRYRIGGGTYGYSLKIYKQWDYAR